VGTPFKTRIPDRRADMPEVPRAYEDPGRNHGGRIEQTVPYVPDSLVRPLKPWQKRAPACCSDAIKVAPVQSGRILCFETPMAPLDVKVKIAR
jgi:hypothetical protein